MNCFSKTLFSHPSFFSGSTVRQINEYQNMLKIQSRACSLLNFLSRKSFEKALKIFCFCVCCIDFCFEKRQFLAVLSYKSSFLSDIDADMQKRGTTPIDFKRKQSCSLDLLALNDMTSPGGKCTNFSYIHKIQ